MPSNPFSVDGLSDKEVLISREKFGSNIIEDKSGSGIWKSLKGTVTEPMFILLVMASVIYFLLGETPEAIFMLAAILLVSAISFYQDTRSRKAVEALKAYTQAQAKVLRNGAVISIPTSGIVMGDLVVAEEGTLIAADGQVLQGNDFSVNESILTGEAFAVLKTYDNTDANVVFQGTTVVSGLALYKVTAIGLQTKLGKIGKSLEDITEEKTPLQEQIGNFVKKMALAGGVVFLIIWGLNYYHSGQLLDSLLKGLTLAMSILPEEIPVAFTTFMALGAWRLMREGIIVKQTKTVETLGSATIICTDKTGTITENRMELAQCYVHSLPAVLAPGEWTSPEAMHLITTAMWSSEPVPFDPMEKALHEAYGKFSQDARKDYNMVHEYPLSGKPPMMTHVFENGAGHRIMACKGAPEGIIRHSGLSDTEQTGIMNHVTSFAQQGYRVLAVAETAWNGNDFPKDQHEFAFQFIGLVSFYDPPKANIKSVFDQFYGAGIQVKIITGDNALTTGAIARQAGFRGADNIIEGSALNELDDEAFASKVASANIFARMFPEAKLRIINTLKKQNHIVAMTGDGVNDGPALKAAHIGIAMGHRGTEIAKQASALILTDDDLGKMITAIAMGRKIYNNLKKAIQYIISIHIPIILTVALPLILGWIYPNIFTPVHVIFLELIMGPTCSIIYENEPLEKNSMQNPPRVMTYSFLSWRELSISLIQGLVISGGTLASYQYAVQHGYAEDLTRSMVFTCLVVANIFLTLVNRSFYYSVFTSMGHRNNMLLVIVAVTTLLMASLLYVPAFSRFFQLAPLAPVELALTSAIGFVSVIWFEFFKWARRLKGHGTINPTP